MFTENDMTQLLEDVRQWITIADSNEDMAKRKYLLLSIMGILTEATRAI
jgi:hypothetical protein